MNSQVLYRTGITMVDLFFNSLTAMLEMQRACVSGGIGHSDQSRRFEHGATEEQVIPIPERELRIGKRQVQSAKPYRVSTKAEVSPKAPHVKTPRETSLKAGVIAAHDFGVVKEQKKLQVQNPGKRKGHPKLRSDTKRRGTRKVHRRRSAAR
jgi:hypothetical protein